VQIPNQQLIADRLKLSRATVSRCFTNHPGINPKTRARVFALAAKLGYTHLERRDANGGRKSARSVVFGVLICVDMPNFDHTTYVNPGQMLLDGVSDFARGQDIWLDLHFVRPEDQTLDGPSYVKIPKSRRRRWSGVVLIYPFPRGVLEQLHIEYPVVSLVEQYSGITMNSVDVNHDLGTGKLVDRLYALGHRRIGFFTWRYPVEAGWARRRFSSYVERLTAYGLPLRMDDVINIGSAQALPVPKAHERLVERTRDGVTAWVCAADHQAYELIEWLQARGIRVPEEVSITGFDGLPRPKGSPLLTTVIIPFHRIGATGGKRLLDLINKRFDAPQSVLLDCELREGETVAPPRLVLTS
jgi:LacI family transcriptional regulator